MVIFGKISSGFSSVDLVIKERPYIISKTDKKLNMHFEDNSLRNTQVKLN